MLLLVLLMNAFLSLGQVNNTNKYGALAIDRSNGFYYGWSNDYSNLAEAESRSLEECKKKGGNCIVVLSFSGNACAVYRTINSNVGNAYGWGVASTKDEADKIATAECLKRSNGMPASNFVWSCNSENAGQLTVYKNLVPSKNQFFGLKDIDGDVYDYEGEVLNNIPHGSGTQTYLSGQKYKGSFTNGMRNGRGIYYFKSGSRVEGEFVNDRLQGSGIYYFSSGRKYVGEFRNDKFNGQGIMYDRDGSVIYKGQYVDNNPAN